ncbi:uncharacterized protein METZ01_LOCUS334731 [marine metagenome]|uniref:Uncharacterized protein n=1 Tax=marine metagenome TaxID=408172 RepID=A0A382QA33_9ZZZZ
MSKNKEEKIVSEKEYVEEKLKELQTPVQPDSELKNIIIQYIGKKHNPENNEVTLAMAIETFASEFHEFLLPIAEENFIRGYQQAMVDVEEGEKYFAEHTDGKVDENSLKKLDGHLKQLEQANEREDA